MAFAITQSCCSDASCVAVCPVNCIHPTPDEPDFATADRLYIDPGGCIDCGACADACPVDAISPIDLLTGPDAAYTEINSAYFDITRRDGTGGGSGDDSGEPDWTSRWGAPRFPAALAPHAAGLRVAIVGSGPAASYTAAELLTTSAEVTMVERLDVAGGLIRFGVAPDHLSTKAIGDRFATVLRHPRMHPVLGVEVGVDISHDDLLAHHDAVVYAVGARSDRRLEVPGEDLPGSLSARTFVGWYNGHPEIDPALVDLAPRGPGKPSRVVIAGNGNVALDAARILLTDPDELAETGIDPGALTELRRSTVRDVVLVARRGPADAAYSLSELRPLLERDDLDVVVDGPPELASAIQAAEPGSPAGALRGVPVVRIDWTGPPADRRRLVLRFDTVLAQVDGAERAEAVCLAPADPTSQPGSTSAQRVPTDLVLRSVGYRSEPVPGLPFDESTHTVPHRAGRVIDPVDGQPVAATYVVGWIKRGPSGGIGTNRGDAAETVASLVADANARRITAGRGSRRSFERVVRRLR